MNALLLVLALVVATASAIRGAWSPCGLSMLSSITPLAERGRGQRFGVTAGWFVVGATAGGATLGLGAAGMAWLAGAAGLGTTTAMGLAAAAAVVTMSSDLKLFGRQLPIHPRQVNEEWLGRYRAWVYGAGFGYQIGFGLATYIMTAGVYLTIVLAVLTASPGWALAIGTTFGLVRGLAILPASRITTPARLASVHRRFDELTEPVRRVVIGVQGATAFVAAAAVWSLPTALVAAVVLGLVVGVATYLRGSRPVAAEVTAR